jgi:HK97 family phage portal protein
VETPQERAERTRRLEDARAARRQSVAGPLELAPGRGDLNRTSGTFDPSLWPVAPNFGGGALELISGGRVSFAKLFATQPWVAAAVMRMLTWAVRVPLKAYRRTSEDSRERLRPGEHPLGEALVRPWERGNQAQLTMAFLGSLLVHGNGLVEVDEGRGGTLRFHPADWRYVAPIKAWRDSIAGWKIAGELGEPARSVSADEMLHVAWWSACGPTGVSPLEQLGVTLAIEDAAQRYQKGVFKQGARPPSAITVTEKFLDKEIINPAERDKLLAQLRDDVQAIYGGPENAGRPALLPPGLDWKPVGHSAVEAELIDQRKVAAVEVAAVYQIPPPMLGQLERATYSNITELRQVAYTDGLGPPLVIVEQAINAQLVWPLYGPDIYVEYDFAGVLRGDRLKEIRALREAIGMALMTPNEGRAVLNAPRSEAPGMDEFYMPVNNLAPVSEGGQPATRRRGRETPALALPAHLEAALVERRTRDPREIPNERKAFSDASCSQP